MDLCRQCGSELGIGRFCTNCGHPVDQPPDAPAPWRSDTAERPRVAEPVEPLPAPTVPAPARFPLFADDVDATDRTEQLSPVPPLPPPPTTGPAQPPRRIAEMAAMGGRCGRDADGGRARRLVAVRQLRRRPRHRPGGPLRQHAHRGADADSRTRHRRSRAPPGPPTPRRSPGTWPRSRTSRLLPRQPRVWAPTGRSCATSPRTCRTGPRDRLADPGRRDRAVGHVPVRRPEHAVGGRPDQRLRQGRPRQQRHPRLVPRQPPAARRRVDVRRRHGRPPAVP